jgi:hypothetical protein
MSEEIKKVYERINAFAASYNIQNLGDACGYPLLYLTPQKISGAPNLLIAGGFHGGEEPAGTLGLLKFLETYSFKDRVNLSFLPLVNPSGFALGQRLNANGGNPNHGFCSRIRTDEVLSEEGEILVKNIAELFEAASDGFLTLHEDCDQSRFYLFTFEQTEKPGPFTSRLFQTECKFFEPITESILIDEKYGTRAFDGAVCFNDCDGTFEDLLFHMGVPYIACTETPGLQPIDERVDANVALIQSFIDWQKERR